MCGLSDMAISDDVQRYSAGAPFQVRYRAVQHGAVRLTYDVSAIVKFLVVYPLSKQWSSFRRTHRLAGTRLRLSAVCV